MNFFNILLWIAGACIEINKRCDLGGNKSCCENLECYELTYCIKINGTV